VKFGVPYRWSKIHRSRGSQISDRSGLVTAGISFDKAELETRFASHLAELIRL
jgi:hypothetical protein